ncbi:MAG: hypothetical protein ABI167_02200 [Nitrosospira sp.]
MKKYTMTQISPLDVINGVKALKDTATIQKWLDFEEEKDVVSSKAYLEWAQNGLDEGSDSGLSSCISHAKLAVCSILDKLLIQNHLSKMLGKNYPAKINMLKEIGISIPSVVHKLIIEPRNELEHKYAKPNLEMAENALGVARLAIRFANLDAFSNNEAITFSQELRFIDEKGKGCGNYRQVSSYRATIYRNLKTLAGI